MSIMIWWQAFRKKSALNKLRSDRWDLRLDGIHQLMQFNGPNVTDAIATMLRDERVGFAAAETLAHIGDLRAVDVLVQCLPELERMWEIRDYEKNIEKAAKLLGLLKWEPKTVVDRVRYGIATRNFGLAANQGAIAVGPLLNYARYFSDSGASIAAVLENIDDPEAVMPLMNFLNEVWQDGSSSATPQVPPEFQQPIRLAAIRALGKIGDDRASQRLNELLHDQSTTVSEEAAAALGKILASKAGRPVEQNWTLAPAFEFFVRGLVDEKEAVARLLWKQLDTSHLKAYKPQVIECLFAEFVSRLSHDDDKVRTHAATVLGRMQDFRTIAPLLSVLRRHTTANSGTAAARALASIASKDVGTLILEVALNARSSAEWRVATEALSRPDANLRDSPAAREAVPRLIRALEEKEDDEVHRRVADILGAIGDERALKPLISATCLVHNTDQILKAAREALKRIKVDWERSEAALRIVPELHDALKGPFALLRQRSASVLARIAGVEALPPLLEALPESDGTAAREICAAIASIGVTAVSALGQRLGDTNVNVRANAALALSMLGAASANTLPALINCLSDRDDTVRLNALQAIANTGPASRGAVPTLIACWKQLDRNLVLSIFDKVGDVSVVAVALEILFETGGRAGDGLVRNLLADLLQDQQVTDWVIKASGYQHEYGGYDHDAGLITLESSDEAVQSLCGVDSAFTTNILHLVSRKKDVSVRMSTGCGSDWDEVVSFKAQRDRAQAELARRGKPPYDPSVYGRQPDDAFRNRTAAEVDRTKQRRYRLLLSLIEAPRGDSGEDRWKYYSELAEHFRTIEVFRILANDLAAHQSILPTKLDRFQGLLARVGQNLNDAEVRSALSPVQGPWPHAHAWVLDRIGTLRRGSNT